MFGFKKRRARKEAARKLKEAEAAKKAEKAVVEEKAPKEEPKPVETPKPVEPKVEKAPVKEEKPEEPKKAAPKKAEPKPVEANEDDQKAKPAKYHISQNKKENTAHYKEWRVRKEGSQKTIKFFKTQAEAIEYAKTLAENQDSSIVIHKLDGTVRKQDYSKK